jgi:ribonuclease-3 family protein
VAFKKIESGVLMDSFFSQLEVPKLSDTDIQMMSPLALAYLGDAVYEIFVRTYIVSTSKMNVNHLNKMSVNFVKAESQAKIAKFIEAELSEEELRILKRGRNQKSASVAKNASIGDYRLATGLESLVGWLYLKEEYKRISILMNMGIRHIEGDK